MKNTRFDLPTHAECLPVKQAATLISIAYLK